MRLDREAGGRLGDVPLDELGMHRIAEIEKLVTEGKRDVVAAWAGMDRPAAAEAQLDEQLLLRPHPKLARGYAHRLAGRIGHSDACWDLADHCGGRWICNVDDEDARVDVCAGAVWIRGCQDGSDRPRAIQVAAGIRGVSAVPDIEEMVEVRQRRIHPSAEKRIVSDQAEVERGSRRSSARADHDGG